MTQSSTTAQQQKRKRVKMIPILIRFTSATNARIRKVTGRRKGEVDIRTFVESAVVEKLDREEKAA